LSASGTDEKVCTARWDRIMRTVSQTNGLSKNPTPTHVPRTGRSRVALLAWMVSILVHIAIFAAFGAVRLSRADTDTQDQPVPGGRVIRTPRPIDAAAVFPKPKVKIPRREAPRKNPQSLAEIDRLFEPDGSTPTLDIKPAEPLAEMIGRHTPALTHTGFFGSVTTTRKLCYVVDCSGSMLGTFETVQRELTESIEQLEPDQYFAIVFFGGPRLRIFGDGRLCRATPGAKSAARTFIEAARPMGRTNALAALRHAMQMRDPSGKPASEVYFLTDGFEPDDTTGTSVVEKVKDMTEDSSSSIRINTIGLWPQSRDRTILLAIAKQSGGEFVSIDRRTKTGDTFSILGLRDQDDR